MPDDVELAADRGEQLVADVTYTSAPTGPAEFVVRAHVGDPDPPLVKIRSDDSPVSATGTVTVTGASVTIKVNGPTTKTLPATAKWALWINPGADDAQAIGGTLRVYEVVQP